MSAMFRNDEAARSSMLSSLPTALLLATSWWLPTPARGQEPLPGATQMILDCSEHVRQFNITANYSWQAVIVQATNRSFSGQCSVYVNLQEYVHDGEQSLQQRQMVALLLKIDQLILGPVADGACDGSGNSLNVFTTSNRSKNARYICNVSTVYLWTSSPIELYVYIRNISSNAPSFSAAFIAVAELVDMCRNGSTELQINSELYVFAPNWRYADIPPNDTPCSNSNYTLTFVGNSSSDGLSLAVLSAPQSGSCCSVLLGGKSCATHCTQSVAPGENSTLHYSCGNCGDGEHSGFTLKAAVNKSTTVAAVDATSSGGTILSFAELLSGPAPSTTWPPESTTLQSTGPSEVTTRWDSSVSPASTSSLPVGKSSSLSSTTSIAVATDAVLTSMVRCLPALTGSPSSSESFTGDERQSIGSPSCPSNVTRNDTTTSSSSSHVPLVVGAVIGAVVCVTLVIAAATVATKHCGCAPLDNTTLGRCSPVMCIWRSSVRRVPYQMSSEQMSCYYCTTIQQGRMTLSSNLGEVERAYELCEMAEVGPQATTLNLDHQVISLRACIDNAAACSFATLEEPERIYSRLGVSVMNEHEYEVISGD